MFQVNDPEMNSELYIQQARLIRDMINELDLLNRSFSEQLQAMIQKLRTNGIERHCAREEPTAQQRDNIRALENARDDVIEVLINIEYVLLGSQ